MRKKVSPRVVAFLIAVAIAAVLINPFWRQRFFGPTYQGVPLCAWQDQIRRQTLGEDEKRWLAKIRKWFEPKTDNNIAEKLTREDRIAIWMSVLDDPAPAMRVRAVHSLWGSRSHRIYEMWTSDIDFTVASRYLVRSTAVSKYNLNGIVDGSSLWASTLSITGESWPLSSMRAGVHPPPPAAPHLIRMLDDPEGEVRQAAFTAAQQLGKDAAPVFPRLFELLEHSDPTRREQALRALNAVHPKTRDWLNRIVAMLEDEHADVRRAAVYALSEWNDCRMAIAAGPALLARSRDADPHVGVQAASTLNSLRIHAAEATESLRIYLRHADAGVRRRAIGCLTNRGAALLFPELLRLAQFDADHNVRCTAIAHLWYGGERAVPLLVALLRDAKTDVRDSALGALRNLGLKGRDAVPYLLADLESIGANALQALGDLRDPAAVPRLLELLDNRDLAQHALAALNAMGPAAAAAGPRLVQQLRQSSDYPDSLVQTLFQIRGEHDHEILQILEQRAHADVAAKRTEWAWIFARQGVRAHMLVPNLIEALSKKINHGTMTAYVQMLGSIGPSAHAAVPALVRIGKDEACHADVRNAIVRTLGEIAAHENLAVPFLIEQLEERRDNAALQALAAFGPRAHAARPFLPAYLNSHDAGERSTAVWTVAAIERPTEAIRQLTPLLIDRDENVRNAAARALASLQPPPEVLRQICRLLHAEENSLRHAVLGALAELGPAAALAIPDLSRLLADDSQSLADAARDALAKIEP